MSERGRPDLRNDRRRCSQTKGKEERGEGPEGSRRGVSESERITPGNGKVHHESPGSSRGPTGRKDTPGVDYVPIKLKNGQYLTYKHGGILNI